MQLTGARVTLARGVANLAHLPPREGREGDKQLKIYNNTCSHSGEGSAERRTFFTFFFILSGEFEWWSDEKNEYLIFDR